MANFFICCSGSADYDCFVFAGSAGCFGSADYGCSGSADYSDCSLQIPPKFFLRSFR